MGKTQYYLSFFVFKLMLVPNICGQPTTARSADDGLGLEQNWKLDLLISQHRSLIDAIEQSRVNQEVMTTQLESLVQAMISPGKLPIKIPPFTWSPPS